MKHKKPNLEKRRDRILSAILVIQLTIMYSKNSLVQGIPFFMNINSQLNIFLLVIIAALYIYGIFKVRSEIKLKFPVVMISIFVIIVWLWGVLLSPESIKYMSETLIRFIPYGLVSFIFYSIISDYKYLMNNFTKASYIMLGSALVSSINLILNARIGALQYTMPLSYFTLLPTMFLIRKFFIDRKIIDLILSTSGIGVIIVFGARTPLLCLFVFVLLMFLNTKLSMKKIVISLTATLSLILIILNLNTVVQSLILLLAKYNLHSRTLSLLLSSNITYLSKREDLYSVLFQSLDKKPLIGIGVGEVKLLMSGGSPHSLILDFIFTFGYIMGPILILALSMLILYAVKIAKTKKNIEIELLILFISLTIPRGIVGGSIWGTEELWWLMGVSISIIYNNRYEKLYSNMN